MWGGDPLTGATELGQAVLHTAQSAQLTTALHKLTNVLTGLTINTGGAQQGGRAVPIFTYSNVDDDDEFGAVADLDEEKLLLLLDASKVKPEHVNAYYKLVASARKGVIKKREACRMADIKRKAVRSGSMDVPDDEIGYDAGKIQALRDKTGIGPAVSDVALARAVTHHSVYSGRETNKRLAITGDTVLRLLLITFCHHGNQSGSVYSDLVTTTQTNSALRDIGVRFGLQEHVMYDGNMDATSKDVMATVVEALFGTVYMAEGMPGVEKLNEVLTVVSPVDMPTVKLEAKEFSG